MSKNIKMGVFGLDRGSALLTSIEAIEGVTLHAVCDKNTEQYEKIKSSNSALTDDVLYFTNFDEFIESGIEAVFLANYFHEHCKFAIRCLEKGIAVLSDTTAAATLKECVQLCEAVEKTGTKYMLGANVPFMDGIIEIDRIYKTGNFGKILYAEGEYFHMEDENDWNRYAPFPSHWRNHLPGPYYNMHSLGPLMYITGEMPKYVNGRSVYAAPTKPAKSYNKAYDAGSFCFYETDKKALFRTTGCCQLGPTGKWFRLICENGTIETKRGNQDWIITTYTPWLKPEGVEKGYEDYDAPKNIKHEIQKTVTHGGSDYLMVQEFVDYLYDRKTPFFTVYPAVSLSAAGIMGWMSVMDNGNCYEIPDFTDKKARAKWADHDKTPFPNEDGTGATWPCSISKFE